MSRAWLLVGALAVLGACRRPEYRSPREPGEAQMVALGVRTDPPGAAVRVNRIGRVWITPCDIADLSLLRGPLAVEITLEGYEPVRTQAYYNGYQPAWLSLKLVRQAPPAAARAAELAPDPGPAPVAALPAPAARPADPAPAAPAAVPVKVEAVAGGTRLRLISHDAKLRIQAKTVVSQADRPGEFFLPDVPPNKVFIELLNAKTDAVLGVVEFEPVAAPAAALPPAPPPAPAARETPSEPDRVGEVKVVSKTYGVFVKLDPGLSVQPGEEILIVRDGREIARTKILKITRSDAQYPDGAAEVRKDASIQKGDEVRRLKP